MSCKNCIHFKVCESLIPAFELCDGCKDFEQKPNYDKPHYNLKPCPFCGCDDIGIYARNGKNNSNFVYVKCTFCYAQSRIFNIQRNLEDEDLLEDGSVMKAVKCWNMRKSKPKSKKPDLTDPERYRGCKL